MDITALKDFLDLGGTFILALVFIYLFYKQFLTMDEKLTQILTLLTVLTKTTTNFNGVDKVLGKSTRDVLDLLVEAEKKDSPV